MEEKSHTGQFCRVNFRVKCVTGFGQAIAVSGTGHALGNLRKDSVVNLVTTPESHPIWYTSEPLVIPRGELVQYRYCLVEGGSVKAFEKTESPRAIRLDNLDTIIEDEFSLEKLEGFGQDSEMELFEQMRQLTRRYSEAEKMVWLNAAQRESRLFLVCYHLPVIVRRTEPGSAEPFEVSWNDSILARSQSSSIADSMRTYWVGTLNIALDALTVVERDFLTARLEQMDIIPVIIDDEIAAAAYFGFCKQVMWPVFHNVDQLDQIHAAWNLQDDFRQTARSALPPNALPPSGMAGGMSANRSRAGSSGALAALTGPQGARSRSNSMASGSAGGSTENNRVLEWNNLEEEFHRAHEAVNLIFARTLLRLVHDKDVVWVHDYHLMGLPRLLRARDERKHRRRGSSSDTERDSRNVSSATTPATGKITAAADAPLEVPASLANLRIIFFMHIPFPTSQLFRTLPRAAELLESMVCADVVGFHAFDHARHFLNATKRMLGIRSGSRPGGLITLHVADREVIVTVSHVSIETDRIGPAALHPETLRLASELREKYAGKRIVVGVDACQRLSGVALKLAAFDKLLSDSSWGRKGNIVLIQKCLRNNTRPGDEETTSADLRKMVADINVKYCGAPSVVVPGNISNLSASSAPAQLQHVQQHGAGLAPQGGSSTAGRFASTYGATSGSTVSNSMATESASSVSTSRGSNLDSLGDALLPAGKLSVPTSSAAHAHQQPTCVVDYEERDSGNELTVHERLALWLVADVFLLTPIREGLNLMPLEYVYVRRDLPNAGAVVVSEFSTCAAMLNGSIKVNPFAPLRVADALEKALMLSSRDKELRRQRDLPFISSHPSYLWTQQVVNDLEQLQTPTGRGEGSTGAVMPSPLKERDVLQSYEIAAQTAGICQAASRLFIFDFGGTLLHKEKYDIYIKRQTLAAIEGRKPTAEMMTALEKLSNDPLNVVVVITGLTKQKLGDTFSGLRNVTLATSNGLVYSWGQNLLPAPHHTRSQLQHLASAAAAAAQALHRADGHGYMPSRPVSLRQPPISSAVACEENKRRERELGEVTQDLIALSLADSEREWTYYRGSSDIDWQAVSNIALPIISKYTFRTNGTCQSPRIPGIGWSYFGADPEEGIRQAKQLTLELEAALANFDVKVASLIQSSLEVVPRTLHKGLLVQPLLEKVMGRRGGRLPGFILVVGDDESDDRMVEVVHRALGEAPPSAAIGACRTFTACVGKRACPSQYYVNDVEDVESLLTRLALSPSTTASASASPSPGGSPSSPSHQAPALAGSSAATYYD